MELIQKHRVSFWGDNNFGNSGDDLYNCILKKIKKASSIHIITMKNEKVLS